MYTLTSSYYCNGLIGVNDFNIGKMYDGLKSTVTKFGFLVKAENGLDWSIFGNSIFVNLLKEQSQDKYYEKNNTYENETVGLIESLDLMELINIEKIENMRQFKDNWNGVGGRAFSEDAINLFETVIMQLLKQPQIAPTGRNSLFMQYESDNKSILAFELGLNGAEKVFVPNGNYSKAETEMITENITSSINESLREFYGI